MDLVRFNGSFPPRRPFVIPIPGAKLPPTWPPQEVACRSNYIADRFGVRLRTLRKARNMTQLDMAIDFGIDRSFISDVERGKKAISLPLLEVIAIGFGLTLSELLSEV